MSIAFRVVVVPFAVPCRAPTRTSATEGPRRQEAPREEGEALAARARARRWQRRTQPLETAAAAAHGCGHRQHRRQGWSEGRRQRRRRSRRSRLRAGARGRAALDGGARQQPRQGQGPRRRLRRRVFLLQRHGWGRRRSQWHDRAPTGGRGLSSFDAAAAGQRQRGRQQACAADTDALPTRRGDGLECACFAAWCCATLSVGSQWVEGAPAKPSRHRGSRRLAAAIFGAACLAPQTTLSQEGVVRANEDDVSRLSARPFFASSWFRCGLAGLGVSQSRGRPWHLSVRFSLFACFAYNSQFFYFRLQEAS